MFRSRLREEAGNESAAVLVGQLEQLGFRVLVADHFEPWRDYACTPLKECDGAYSIHQTIDGWETAQNAHELQSDLILLDISLAKTNGIEAARQRCSKCPKSKMFFVNVDPWMSYGSVQHREAGIRRQVRCS